MLNDDDDEDDDDSEGEYDIHLFTSLHSFLSSLIEISSKKKREGKTRQGWTYVIN